MTGRLINLMIMRRCEDEKDNIIKGADRDT